MENKIVYVKFKSDYTDEWNVDIGEFDTAYSYIKPSNMELIIGDYVVVETVYGLALAVIVKITEELVTPPINKKIVVKVEGYNVLEDIKKKLRKQELENKIRDFEKKLKVEEKYKLMVEAFGDDVKSLIDEYKNLD